MVNAIYRNPHAKIDADIKIAQIILYFLNNKTIFDINADEINPPKITIDPVIEYYESRKPKGFIKYGTIKPNPLRLPK